MLVMLTESTKSHIAEDLNTGVKTCILYILCQRFLIWVLWTPKGVLERPLFCVYISVYSEEGCCMHKIEQKVRNLLCWVTFNCPNSTLYSRFVTLWILQGTVNVLCIYSSARFFAKPQNYIICWGKGTGCHQWEDAPKKRCSTDSRWGWQEGSGTSITTGQSEQ